MADTHKQSESPKPSDKPSAAKHTEHKAEPKAGEKPAHKPASKSEHKPPAKAAPKAAPEKGGHQPKAEKRTGPKKKAAEATKRAVAKGAKKGAEAKAAPKQDVKIVDQPTIPNHVAHPKPTLTAAQRYGLSLRATIDGRRPRFRRQQWYEYKRLANSGWRRPTGVDSAMRRHFGYEQSVVRIGFGGPREVRGLHPSGFREVYVEHVDDLKGIDVKTQAARVSGRLGARKLRDLYKEAEKLGIHILNRRNLK